MTNFTQHAAAAIVAVLIATTSMVAIVSVPPSDNTPVVSVPTLA